MHLAHPRPLNHAHSASLLLVHGRAHLLKVKLVGAGSELALNHRSSAEITNPYKYSQACLAKSGATGLDP